MKTNLSSRQCSLGRTLAGNLLLALMPAMPALADTTSVVTAANAFLDTVSTAQKTAIDSTSSPVNSSCLYNFSLSNVEVWSNLPISTSLSGATRNGLIYSALTDAQKTAAEAVAGAALSATGKSLRDHIRASDRYISGEVANAKGTTSAGWGYNKYFIGFIGAPSTTAPWTLQLGGHHLAYNLTYNGTYPSATPMFAGTEPNSWTDSTGTYAPLGVQRDLLQQLRPTLTTTAQLTGTFSDVVFGPNGSGPGNTSGHDTTQPKAYPTSGRGQLYSSLNDTQKALVRSYLQSWINFVSSPVAEEMAAIYLSDQALAETYIGYSGSSTTLAANANYFRVDGPRVWIEFSVQTGVYDRNSVHDHGVFRDKLADYGAAYGSTTIATTLRPPTITTQPDGQSVSEGDGVTLSVAAASAGTGSATLSYQWYKGDSALTEATSSSYTINPVTAANAGSYTVKVISTGGWVTSEAAVLSVGTTGTAPTVSSPTVVDGNFQFLITGTVGQTYAIEATTDPATTWNVLTTINLTASPLLWTDEDSANHAVRYYRVLQAQ